MPKDLGLSCFAWLTMLAGFWLLAYAISGVTQCPSYGAYTFCLIVLGVGAFEGLVGLFILVALSEGSP